MCEKKKEFDLLRNIKIIAVSTHSDFDDEVESLQALSADMIVEACVRCLQIIDPEFQSPKTLPEAMSARYRMCSTLANAIQV